MQQYNSASELANRKEFTVKDELNFLLGLNTDVDSKLGWSTAFFALIISSMVALGIAFGHWYIIGPFMALPLLSLVMLIMGLNPKRDYYKTIEKNIDKRVIQRQFDQNQIDQQTFDPNINPSRIRSRSISETDLLETIDMLTKLWKSKMKFIKLAFSITFSWIIFPAIIMYINFATTLNKIKNKK